MSEHASRREEPGTSNTPRPDAAGSFAPWRAKLHEVIFEADTRAGKAFDVALLIAILVSVVTVSLETVGPVEQRYGNLLTAIEWTITILFTIEYVLRLLCVASPWRYATSFFGIVDLLAIVPTYLSVLIPGSQSLVVIRSLRLLRIFRVFKLGHFLTEAAALRRAVWQARGKIVVFLTTVLIAVSIMGSAMYLVENYDQPSEQFTSIPQGMYWAVVTMTTVGYGDIVPETALGKFLSAILIIMGYSLIIVPTGFVSAELVGAKVATRPVSTQTCTHCMREGHDVDATFCKHCGTRL
jgi:voltage-gated potassium channel